MPSTAHDRATIDKIKTAAAKIGLDPATALAVADAESDINPYVRDSTKNGVILGIGVMQINPTGAGSGFTVAELRNPDNNIKIGVRYLKQQIDANDGDVQKGVAAYNVGPGALSKAIATAGPTGNWLARMPDETKAYVGKITGVYSPPSGAGGSQGGSQGVIDDVAAKPSVEVQPLAPVTSSITEYKTLFPDVIDPNGMDEKPWYTDTNLVTGNPKVRGSVNPVVFEVILKGRESRLLSNSSDTPIQIQLNASLKTFSVSSKHVTSQKRTRTGWHITMWGMQADTIEGTCSTGVFMNQFGLANFFSTAQVNQKVIDMVTAGFTTLSAKEGSYSDLSRQVSPDTITSIVRQDTDKMALASLLNSGLMRVAAQDAFVELLSLFKNNGIVWLNNRDGLWGDKDYPTEQVGVDEWSPQAGMSATAKNSRNNDVMTRGSVLMKFKGATYMGYFKSLSWSMDAQKPYSWDFSFIFQVEKTLGFVFSPSSFSQVSSQISSGIAPVDSGPAAMGKSASMAF